MPDRVAAIHALKTVLCQRRAAGKEEIYLTKAAREVLEQGIDVAQEVKGPACLAEDASSGGDGSPGIVDAGKVLPASYEGEGPEEQIASLRKQAADHPAARSLGSLRETLVFSVGDPSADLMLVADAPGAEEEKQGQPVAGKAGQKLDQILKAMGLSREAVYLSNLCKFRPDMGRDQGFDTRKPTPEEVCACLPFVLAELEVVRPKVVVALGGTAAEGLLQIERAKVANMRGRFHDLDGIPLLVTYHPSFILRAEEDPDGGMAKKRLAWEDMLLVMEKLGLPISSKQQGYFK